MLNIRIKMDAFISRLSTKLSNRFLVSHREQTFYVDRNQYFVEKLLGEMQGGDDEEEIKSYQVLFA